MNNILITSAGRRVSLVNHFKSACKELNLNSKIFITDLKPNMAPAFYFSDGYLDLPPNDSNKFIDKLITECLKNKIKIIIPTSDLEILTLSNSKSVLNDNGIDIVISDTKLIDKCRDKRLTDELFKILEIEIIKKQSIENLYFPVFVKPYNGSLSKGIAVYNSIDEIPESQLKNNDLIWMDYLSPNQFKEYTIDCYYDKLGLLKCLVPRERIEIRGGEISKGKTIKGLLHNRLFSSMKKLNGAIGCITLQVFASLDFSIIYGVEINPRFGGGYPLSFHAGANFPLFILKEYFLNEQIEVYSDWIENKFMIRYDQEITFNL